MRKGLSARSLILGLIVSLGAAPFARAEPCEHLLLLAEQFTQPWDIVNSAERLNNGISGTVYKVPSAPIGFGAAKIYKFDAEAENDQRTLDYLRSHAEPSDPVRIAPSFVRGRVMWHPYIDGETLEATVLRLPRDDPRRTELLRRYRQYLFLELGRQRRIFGNNLHVQFDAHPTKDPGYEDLWWFSSNLKPFLGPRLGLRYFIPHTENVVVERGTDQLWLIDPK